MTQATIQQPVLRATWRHAAAVVVIASAAIFGRRWLGGWESVWGAAWFGVVMFGGQSAVIASMSGRLHDDPRRAGLAISLMTVLGGAVGAWVLR